jgi:hypothetical protein
MAATLCEVELTLDADAGLMPKSIDDFIGMGRDQPRGGWKMEELSPAGDGVGPSAVVR